VGQKEFQNLRGIRPSVAKRQRDGRYIARQRPTDDRRGEQVQSEATTDKTSRILQEAFDLSS
jgi:hypothetical protein